MYSGYSDIGAPQGAVFQLQPTLLESDAAPLLQLADIAAYMCSHSVDISSKGNFFRAQLSRVKAVVTASFAQANPQAQPEITCSYKRSC
jgi:hypothetical protein